MNRKSIRRDILTFLKNPTFEKSFDSETHTKIVVLFKVLILSYIGVIISRIPIAILQLSKFIEPIEMKSFQVLDTINKNQHDYKPYFLLLVIVILPIFEEISFRLALTKFNNNFLQLSISTLFGNIAASLLYSFLWWPTTSLSFFLITIFYILAISSFFYILLNLSPKWLKSLKIYWERKPNIIFYTSAILFAILHIMNLDLKTSDLIYLPLILLPFLVLGISFGYLRIRLGFIYSIALHVIINGIAIIIT